MKRNVLTAILFIFVVMCVSGGVYLKWDEVQKPEAEQRISFEHLQGGRYNPIKNFSGETYLATDEDSGVSMQLPIEFKSMIDFDGLKSSQLLVSGYSNNSSNVESENLDEYISPYVFGLGVTNRQVFEDDWIGYEVEAKAYPEMKNVKVGQSYTYERWNDETKRELFGDDYAYQDIVNEVTFTRLPDKGLWKVYRYEDINGAEDSIGYWSFLDTETHLVTALYFTHYIKPGKLREEVLNHRIDSYYLILESTRVN